MAGPPFTDLYGMLQDVRKRPDMWVREKSLKELETLTRGYESALVIHRVEEFGTNFFPRFTSFLQVKGFKWLHLGWALAISRRHRTPERAFDRFFKLLDEFRAGL